MSDARCDDVRVALGALALGALEPAEERQVREHLAECPECAHEAESLAATAGALALLDTAEAVGEAPIPSSDLLPRVLAQVRRARLRRRLVGLAVAAAIAVAAGLGGLGLAGSDTEPDGTPPVASESGQDGGIILEVDAWDRGWGTALQATISGVPAGSRCSLVAVGGDGTREVGATWVVPGDGYEEAGTLTVDGAVGLRSWNVDHYEVVTVEGRTLVTTTSS